MIPDVGIKGNPKGASWKFHIFNSFSVRGVLISIPLILAAFALLLQVTSHRPSLDTASFGLFNEKEFNKRVEHTPKLESELTAMRQRAQKRSSFRSRMKDFAGEQWVLPGQGEGPTIVFTVTTAESAPQIQIWLAYHRAIGVNLFYLFTEGQANTKEAIAILRSEPGVTVIPNDEDLDKRRKASHVWQENWLAGFFNKPCNHELFVKQSLNMEIAIKMARADKADWILHIDTDELIYPAGSPSYSLTEVLGTVPKDVDLLVFPNYESLPESADVEDPFTQVTLFKRNYAHVVSEVYFKNYPKVQRNNPNYFITYGNGKSAARVVDGLRPNGAHRWHNYKRTPKEWSSDQSAVLHYTYNRFSDLKSRRDRCDCAPTEKDAERCFILPFDRVAFIEASVKNDEELMKFFRERLVWEDQKVVEELLKGGLFVRLYEPQLMVRGFKEAHRLLELHANQSAALAAATTKTEAETETKTTTTASMQQQLAKQVAERHKENLNASQQQAAAQKDQVAVVKSSATTQEEEDDIVEDEFDDDDFVADDEEEDDS